MCDAELSPWPEGVQRVAAFLADRGHAHGPRMLDAAARTAQQAADALGVELGQIAKSIVFRRRPDDVAVLVVTAGDRFVDEEKVQALACGDGQRLGRADAAFVKAQTGFSIGGVPPVAHAQPVWLLLDDSLLRFDTLWAAAGHPEAVFELDPAALSALTDAPFLAVAVSLLPLPFSSQSSSSSSSLSSSPPSLTPWARLAERARQVPASGPVVPSPCLSVCRIHAVTGWCEGCLRTLPEIGAWSALSPEARRGVWKVIAQRLPVAEATFKNA